MNGKGRLIVAKNGKYSHLTMLSQISTRNREEIEKKSFHKKKFPPSALPFATRSFPRFYLSTTQAFLPRARYGTGPLSSPVARLASRHDQGSWQLVGDGRRQSAYSRAYLSLFVTLSLTDTLPFDFRAAVPLSPAHLSRLSPQWIRYSRSSPSSSFK